VLLGPAMADSAYQIYADGKLLGGIGDFSRSVPVAYGIHPVRFTFSSSGQQTLVAVRVWMGRFASGPGSGGMHVAPVLGNADGAEAVYTMQWIEKIRAFVLEIAQAFFFVVLAVAALSILPFDRAKLGLVMLAGALFLTALWRANLAFFWLAGNEGIGSFVHWHIDLLVPLTLAAWTLAWCYLFRLGESRWVTIVVGAMTLLYVIAEVVKRPAFDGGLSPALASAAALVSKWDRYAFLALLIYILYRGFRERDGEARFALPAIGLISIGQFAGELGALGVPTIWFPFGMGVSLANYAYLISTPVIAALLWSCVYIRTAALPLTL
jgi:hypothetical protein